MRHTRIVVLTAVLCSIFAGGTSRKAEASGYTPPVIKLLEEDSMWGERKATFYYTEGIKAALVEEDMDAAMKLYRMAIKADSLHAPSYYEYSNALVQSALGRGGVSKEVLDSAFKYSLKASEIDTTNSWYRSQTGRLLVFSGRYKEAAEIYGRLVKDEPNNPDNYRFLAALYEANEQPYAAIAVLDTAQSRLGIIDELARMKLELLTRVKMYDKAIAESKDVINAYPYQAQGYVTLASLYGLTRNDSLAVANFEEAVRLEPRNPEVLLPALSYYRNSNNAEAMFAVARRLFQLDDVPVEDKLAFFEELTARTDFYRAYYPRINELARTLALKYPDNEQVSVIYIRHLIASGEIEAALEIHKTAIAINPEAKERYYAIIEIEDYLERPDSVEKYTALALRQFPNDYDLYMMQGYRYSAAGENEKAKTAMEKALKFAPGDSVRSVIYGVIGDTYHIAGNMKKAYAMYDRALKFNPDNPMVLNNYAYFLSEEGRKLNKALAMTERSNKLETSNSTYLDTHAWVLYKLGRYAEAKKIMQLAISLDRSESAELAKHYGDILYALGDNFMASVYWQKALERGADEAEIAERMKKIE